MTQSDLSNSSDPSSSSAHWQRRKRIITIFSVTLIVLSVLSVAAQVGALLLNGPFSVACAGIWCGLLYAATGTWGLLGVGNCACNQQSNKYLLVLAILSSLASVGMITLAALSLVSTYSKANPESSLWIVVNSLLAVMGTAGLITSSVLAIGSTMPVHPIQRPEEPKKVEMSTLPHYQLQETAHRPVVKQDSQASSGIYESMGSYTSEKYHPPSMDQHVNLPSSADPVYALPIKKNKSADSIQTATESAGGDFEIQVDHGQEDQKETTGHRRLTSSFLVNRTADIDINSDDEGKHSKDIQLSPDEFIIHSPPTNFNNLTQPPCS